MCGIVLKRLLEKSLRAGKQKSNFLGNLKLRGGASMSLCLMSQAALNSLQNKRKPFPIVNFALSWHQLRDLQYLRFIIAFHSLSSNFPPFYWRIALLSSRRCVMSCEQTARVSAGMSPADSAKKKFVSQAFKSTVKASQSSTTSSEQLTLWMMPAVCKCLMPHSIW